MHALESFSQLVNRDYSIEAVEIYDSPRFAFRGAQTSPVTENDDNESVKHEIYTNVCVYWHDRIYD